MLRSAFLAVSVFLLAAAGAARAESPGQAIASGDSARAAAALTASLSEALGRSRTRLQAPHIDVLQAALTRDLSPLASLSRRRPRVDIEIVWRESVQSQRRGACNGFVDVGDARVTATSTARSSRPGVAQFSCSLMTQDDRAYGWTGLWLLSPGEGALYARMSASSDDPAVRNIASHSLQRALQRMAAAVQPVNAAQPRPPRRAAPPPQPQQPRSPRQRQRPPPIEETI